MPPSAPGGRGSPLAPLGGRGSPPCAAVCSLEAGEGPLAPPSAPWWPAAASVPPTRRRRPGKKVPRTGSPAPLVVLRAGGGRRPPRHPRAAGGRGRPPRPLRAGRHPSRQPCALAARTRRHLCLPWPDRGRKWRGKRGGWEEGAERERRRWALVDKAGGERIGGDKKWVDCRWWLMFVSGRFLVRY